MAGLAVIPSCIVDSRFLEGLAPSALRTIVSAAKQRRYIANSVIVNQGHPAEFFFLLLSGRVRYFCLSPDGRKVILRWLVPGDIVSPAALLSRPSEYLVSSEAVKNSSMLVWDRATLRDLIVRYPQLIDNVLSIVYDYMAYYRDAHISLTCDTASQRVAYVLISLADSLGRRIAGGTELDVRNEELANVANVTPFTVSRLLSDWQRRGFLTKRRGSVVLHSPMRLLARSR
jgi:CRP/FNR family transcriptional regulator, nitrogen oxide reductase regulator